MYSHFHLCHITLFLWKTLDYFHELLRTKLKDIRNLNDSFVSRMSLLRTEKNQKMIYRDGLIRGRVIHQFSDKTIRVIKKWIKLDVYFLLHSNISVFKENY